MSKTMMRCGRLIAAYVDDGQGRRLVIGAEDRKLTPLVLGQSQDEIRDAIATLRQLLEELPPGTGGTPHARREPIAL